MLPAAAFQRDGITEVLDRSDQLDCLAHVLMWGSSGVCFGSSHFEGQSAHDCVYVAPRLHSIRSTRLPHLFVFLEPDVGVIYS